MAITLPNLPYARDALAPVISAETLDYHYGKHHQAYVTNLNNLIKGTQWEGQELEQIIGGTEGGLFNNAAQIWNHSFYWNCLRPNGGGDPPAEVAELLVRDFGSVEAFKEQFSTASVTQFGSGWGWLLRDPEGKLVVQSTSNAGCPVGGDKRAILTCDVWEHAYYIDYRNARPKYVEAFWELVNWDFVAANLGL